MSNIILTENVRNLGKIGSIVNVKSGYAFNYLIPTGKAIPATEENVKVIEIKRKDLIKQDEEAKKVAQTLANQMPKTIFIAKPVNENGTLYGAISQKDVVAELPKIASKHMVHFKNSIISYGVHTAELELHHDVVLQIQISVSDTKENAKLQIEKKQNAETATPSIIEA